MKMRMVIIAACAGTFAIAQTELLQAGYVGTTGTERGEMLDGAQQDVQIMARSRVTEIKKKVRYRGERSKSKKALPTSGLSGQQLN